MQTTETTLEQKLILAKLSWEQSRQQYQDSLRFLNETIQEAAEDMTQSKIARTLEWPRQRVSKLLADLAEYAQG